MQQKLWAFDQGCRVSFCHFSFLQCKMLRQCRASLQSFGNPDFEGQKQSKRGSHMGRLDLSLGEGDQFCCTLWVVTLQCHPPPPSQADLMAFVWRFPLGLAERRTNLHNSNSIKNHFWGGIRELHHQIADDDPDSLVSHFRSEMSQDRRGRR